MIFKSTFSQGASGWGTGYFFSQQFFNNKAKIRYFLKTIFVLQAIACSIPLHSLQAQVKEEWVRSYIGPGISIDAAQSITTDIEGNVYVTGGVDNFTTVKYDAQGNQKWVKLYNGPENGKDKAVAIATDKEGYIYVTGSSFGGVNGQEIYPEDYNYDFLTIKYNKQGEQLWVKRYSTAYGVDEATDLATDLEGNVYVTGGSRSIIQREHNNYVTTIKYDKAGNQLWIKTSDKGTKAAALTLDAQSNVYVTGYIQGIPGYEAVYSSGVVTIKYDSQGNEQWAKTFLGQNYTDTVADIVVDSQGNVYVVGSSAFRNQYYEFQNYLLTLKYNRNGNQQWVEYAYSSWGIDPAIIGYGIALDEQGNAYVTGVSKIDYYNNGSGREYMTIKYGYNGEQLWKQNYSQAENIAIGSTDIAVDDQGNAYVGGNQGLVKYNSQGEQIWVQSYQGSAREIMLDAQNNIYITGSIITDSTYYDFLTAKYSQQTTPVACSATGSILQEMWLNVTGSLVSDIPVSTPPTASAQLTSFESITNQGNNYGERIRGYLCVPQNGTYTFYLSGDDRCELWLSSDDDPAKKVKIAAVPYFTAVREWSKYASQKSVAILLAAGKKYYIEALHKEGPYLDNLAVGWQTSPTSPISVIPGSALSPYVPQGEGKISREYWANVPGSLVTDIPLNTAPTLTDVLTTFETATNAAHNYGQRIRGYLHPQVSGNYRFYIAGDDRCELWLSTDENPEKKTKIASVPYYTGVREWNKYASQQSTLLYLVAGKKYFMEALHKEGPYADNLAIGWSMPGQSTISVITGSYLSPFLASPTTSTARVGAAESFAGNMSLFPNPFEDKLTLTHSQPGKLYISVVDHLGRTVYQGTTQTGNELNLAYLKQGVYVVKVATEEGKTQVMRVVKK